MCEPPTIPGYRLHFKIGKGGAGEVWFAREALTGVRRAVKVLPKAVGVDTAHAERELEGIREYQRHSRGHPHLVQIYNVDQTDECYYYAMELADPIDPPPPSPTAPDPAQIPPPAGEVVASRGARRPARPASDPGDYRPCTLEAIIQREAPLPADRALDIIAQLLRALAHLHKQGLVHRDVKPANALMVGGHIKLSDMGLLTVMDRDVSLLGTPGYMPPRDAVLDQTADVYAAGIVLYEMLTKLHRSRFPELPVFEPRSRRAFYELREAIRICNRAAHNDRKARYPSAELFLQDVMARRASRRWPLTRIAALILLAIVLTAAAGLGIVRSGLISKGAADAPFVDFAATDEELAQGILRLHYADNRVLRARLPGPITAPVEWDEDNDGRPLIVAGLADVGELIWFRPPPGAAPLRPQDVHGIDLREQPPWTHQDFALKCTPEAVLTADLDRQPGDELVVAVSYENCPTHFIVFTRGWKRLSHYWHYGMMGGVAAADLLGDPLPELICWGLANARPPEPSFGAIDEVYHSAIMILDPRRGGEEAGHWSMNAWMNERSPYPPLAYGHLAGATHGWHGFDPWAITNVTVFQQVRYPIRVSLLDCGFFDLTADLSSADRHRGIDASDARYAGLPPLERIWTPRWPLNPDKKPGSVTEAAGSRE